VLVSGQIWVQVPQTVFMRWSGRLALGVTAKDMMLAMIGRFGVNVGHHQAIEYCGEAVSALSINERMTLTNMSAELGAQTGLIAPDDETRTWLWQAGARDIQLDGWRSDEDAPGVRHNFDASTLAPQIALPHSPAQSRDVADIEPTAIQIAHIGACTGAKLDDLRAAARVLAGYRVDKRVRLLVAPASVHERQVAESEGILRRLQEAGAEIMPAACGLCAGHGEGVPEDSTVISSIARNSKGRLGSESARVFLASPYTVAASALRGRITDPREVLWDADAEGAR
jgi:3-isopropylmalate/(R)-2-methylmalate dehydratase large subunit